VVLATLKGRFRISDEELERKSKSTRDTHGKEEKHSRMCMHTWKEKHAERSVHVDKGKKTRTKKKRVVNGESS
jgi:hypothetical protein